MIKIYEPNITRYSSNAIRAIESGWISNHGEYVEKSVNKLKQIMNVQNCILMANGTCATHCLFLSIKYKYPEIQKIYVPNNAYVAAFNSALMVYDINQLEVMEMDINTWNINTREEYILSLDTNSAVLIVHNLGNIINVPRLKTLRPDLIFVEDNCEGLFGKYNDIYSGTSSDILCASVSFYGNKIITTGEGGAFLTQHKDVYDYILKVYSQGMSNIKYLHEVHAYNYRMTNIQAAFLYDQLNDIDNILNRKRMVFDNYKRLLQKLIEDGKIKLFDNEEYTDNADWIFSIRIVGNTKTIEETTSYFQYLNIEIRPFFYPINAHSHLSSIPNNDKVSDILNKEIIMIPSSPNITAEQQMTVVNAIHKLCSISVRNVLKFNVFDLINTNTVFYTDNTYYNIIRNNVKTFINNTIQDHSYKIILEIGPKQNNNERIQSVNNIIETVDIVDNNTTYVADLTKNNNLPKNYFDVVYCLEVLEHTYEPWELLNQIYKLLKPSGYLYISVPFQFRIHGPLPDCYRISEFGLKYLIEKYNFEIIQFDAIIDNDRPAFPIHYTISCKKII